ncbi:uncharacterized protein LOC123715045 isoform X1 [Pieris brassicae]|uniref:uncharacterized protein LOC123715045 isoform X1 n=1 Tax=Pieris brassicae TaxID=7116 RepID=UPI001E660F71|nr:uncharacterized protein LOC123715045 isoform X1 [Pieris brassicae]XP_045525789.1 uncharacterized protein LOC123715045 isoform X1 [Pieris brassicae]
MVRFGYTSLLLFICVTDTTSQYYDIFSDLQPFLQTSRPYYDVAQNTRKATSKARLNHATESTTRHTATPVQSSHSNVKRTQKPKNSKDVSKNDQVHFINDGYSNRYTTQNPFSNRPGVKPAVTNGPPITNKPPSTAAFVSPELILGPDVTYMSSTERRRHLDLAEKMCDKYKSLDVKQVQAIPLVPSPRPIKVNVSSCLPSKVPLVVGGVIVNIKDFPHMTLLGWPKIHSAEYSWKCGGSLLSDRYVLTAAHCAYQDKDNNVQTGPPHAVQLGSSYLNDAGALVVKVSAAIRHPNYKLPKSYYDIALIKMAKSVSFSEVIRPACLGTPPSPGDHIIASGWGKTEFGGDQSPELRSVSIPVWDIPQCREVLGTSRKIPEGPSRDTQICAGELNGGKDTCQGDSGGPAQIQDGCVWRIVAVTSLGRSCGAPRTPALYAIANPVFISAVVFSEQTNKRNVVNSRNANQNNQGSTRVTNKNDNKRRETHETGNSRTQNDGKLYYDGDQGYDGYNTRTESINQNKRNNNQNTDTSNYNQNTHNVDSVSDYNENSRHTYESTTIKYINYDSYDAIHKINQQNYYQTDKNLKQQNQQNYHQESSNQNYNDYQNDDSDTYSRNKYNNGNDNNDRNSNNDRNTYNNRNNNNNRNTNNDWNNNNDRNSYNYRNSNNDWNNNNDRNGYYSRNNYSNRDNQYDSQSEGRVWWT